MDKIPYNSHELIAALDEHFPHRCPDPGQTDREIWMDVGQRRLIDFLKSRLADDESNILNEATL